MWVGEGQAEGQWYEGGEEKHDKLIPGVSNNDRQVLYQFYKKPMSSRLTMLARSALSNNWKVSTASAEVLRRLKRTSTALNQETAEKIIMDYMDDLCGMGYGLE